MCLCDTWFLLFCMDDCLVCRVHYIPCIPDSHPYRITSTKCRINTFVSPDDWHIVARNMQRLINILRIYILNCAPGWLYLQDETGMHSQQNIKFSNYCVSKLSNITYCLNSWKDLIFYGSSEGIGEGGGGVVTLTLRRRIKSHLLFAGIIRSSPFSLRQQDKG